MERKFRVSEKREKKRKRKLLPKIENKRWKEMKRNKITKASYASRLFLYDRRVETLTGLNLDCLHTYIIGGGASITYIYMWPSQSSGSMTTPDPHRDRLQLHLIVPVYFLTNCPDQSVQ